MLKPQRNTGTEKAPGSLPKGITEGHVLADSQSYNSNEGKVKRTPNWPENGLEFLFIYPVDDGGEAYELYKEMKKNCDRGILVMVFRNNSCLSCGQDFKPVMDETLCEHCGRQESDLLHWR